MSEWLPAGRLESCFRQERGTSPQALIGTDWHRLAQPHVGHSFLGMLLQAQREANDYYVPGRIFGTVSYLPPLSEWLWSPCSSFSSGYYELLPWVKLTAAWSHKWQKVQ
jgi:hypothetical protein